MRFGSITIALLAAGCYEYRPTTQPAPARGTEVRARLSTPASVRIGDMTIDDVDRVEGLLYYVSGDSLLLSGSWVTTRRGSRYATNGGVLYFERPQVSALEVRRLSPARTGLASVITVGVLVGMFAAVEQALGGSGPPGSGGGDGN